MTVSSSTSKITYNGNGSTTVFAYTFYILNNSDILVQLKNTSTGVITTPTITTDYTVSGAGTASGGNVTFLSAPAAGYTVILSRNMDYLQSTDYNEYDTFPASSHETALDKLTMEAQQLKEGLDRSLKFDAAVSGVSTTIVGTPAAGNTVRVNSGATALEYANLATTGTSYGFPVGTGVLVQTSTGNAVARTITGTANEITITNGDGVSGNPTASIPTALTFTGKTITGGTYSSPSLTTANLGTPIDGTLTNCTSLPISTGVSGLGTGVATFLGTPTLANWANVVSTVATVKRQVFTSSGTYTPSTGMLYCWVRLLGSGGGGGSSAATAAGHNNVAGGGGGGGYSEIVYTAANIGASATVTIASAGTGGSSGANNAGNSAGSSSFVPAGTGATLTCNGGSGGGAGSDSTTTTYSSPGAGGTASGGDINVTGGSGTPGVMTSLSLLLQGQGGGSAMSPATGVHTSGAGNVLAGQGPGGGGSGAWLLASASSIAGGNGTKGICEVIEFCTR